tara:strand:- start:4887 stop:5084 length:198 start_codon:yes stop_codon:yes gene_type:complete
MKTGIKTSEFWIVVGTLIIGASMGFFAIIKGHEYLIGTAAIIGALSPHTIGYAIARTNAKRNTDV